MTLNLSPTQIETFDEKQQWGCQRKWYFQYAPLGPRIKQPETQDMANGTELHHAIEAELLGQPKKTLSFLGEQMLRAALPMVGEVIGSHFGALTEVTTLAPCVEQKMRLVVPRYDVVINGRIDLITPRGIVDWKSKGDLGKAKTSAQLRDDHQMNLYGVWFTQERPDAQEVVLEHGIVTSKAPFEAKRVAVKISKTDLTNRFENVILPLVSEMVELAKSDKVEDFKPKHNEICKRCPFSSQCPQGKTKAMDIAAFLAAQRNPQPAAPAPAPAPAPQPPPAAPVSAVLPPDAPKRQPVKMMPVDVETPPAVTAPETAPAVEAAPAPAPAQAPLKKGPGRPPGSKNKPKEPEVVLAPPVQPSLPVVIAPGMTAKTVTFTQGHTVNLGDFNSVRFDISYTAECNGKGFEAALAEAREAVQKEVMVELERFSAMAAKGVKK